METLGDPVAMRAAAARLQLRADTLGALAARIENRVGGMGFAGPAADRFRAGMSDRHTRLVRVVTRLQDLADTLLRAAAQAEAAQLQAQLGAAGSVGSEPGEME